MTIITDYSSAPACAQATEFAALQQVIEFFEDLRNWQRTRGSYPAGARRLADRAWGDATQATCRLRGLPPCFGGKWYYHLPIE